MTNDKKELKKLSEQAVREIIDNFYFGNIFGDNEDNNGLMKILTIANSVLLVILLLLLILRT